MKLLSQMWSGIQGYLFPYLEENIGPLTEKLKQLVAILEVVRIEEFVGGSNKIRGRSQKNRKAIARAFVAKAVYNLGSTRALIDQLKTNGSLRRICGFERERDIPHESTFSRAFEEYATSQLPQRVHEAIVEVHLREKIVDHISRDSSAIEGNEKATVLPKPEKEEVPKRKPGRPKKGEEVSTKEPTRLQRQPHMTLEEMLNDLPTHCDRGVKKNSQGYKISWNGYKLHLDVADGGIIISGLLTSASLHDSQAAIPLMAMTAEKVINLYDLMDAAYDAEAIREYARSKGHVPIIDSNGRRGSKEEMDPATKQRYNERSTVERCFGRLKEEFGANHVRVRGAVKVMAHLMFGILALTADQMLRLVS